MADQELTRLAELSTAWEAYVERVQTAAALLAQASDQLRARLLQDCQAFAQRCQGFVDDMRASAPYDGKVCVLLASGSPCCPCSHSAPSAEQHQVALMAAA